MAYQARDGRWYTHKETPNEYRTRKGIPSRFQSGEPLGWKSVLVGIGGAILISVISVFVDEYR